ncbi:MAG TPA: S41 family peptidase, partial [Phototrophicaceae bacterium]|nr:S41 family peptidase [Phototrophicaceae bacterium]
DRFTFFIEPPTAASESDVLAGTYGGIGVQIHRNEQGQFALYPYKDSPAAAAGIADGDILTQINGQPLDPNVGQDSIDQMMRGEVKQGNGVQITVTQAASGKSLTVLIPFAVINVPSVTYRVLAEDPTIGYVQISIITSRTPDELKAALQDLTSKNVKSLVLDLRNNTGGLLEESVQVANAFIASGPIVFEDNKQGEQTYSAQSSGLITTLPMVVLVNGMTASGAELIAGAIQDDQRGVLIGQKTYGKGTVQEIFSLSDKSSLHITAAEWLTPKKHHLDGVGLTPDIPVTPDAQGRDLELGQAVQYLEGKPGTVAATPQAASQTNAVTISTTEAATTSP